MYSCSTTRLRTLAPRYISTLSKLRRQYVSLSFFFFRLSRDFSTELSIPQVEESHRTQCAVEGDRKHYLDAAIVRVMKARKQLTYEQIKTETIEAVRRHFIPDVLNIKQ